jgi:hypothetical protein
MEPEERKMLERLVQISEQNNRMLQKMRRAVLWGRFVHMVYLIVIVSLSVASYYYIKPYIGTLTSALNTLNQYSNMPR